MSSITDYLVTQEGVYRHRVYGPFRGYETALRAALWLAANDSDDYHTYDVAQMPEDTKPLARLAQEGETKHLKGVSRVPRAKNRPGVCSSLLELPHPDIYDPNNPQPNAGQPQEDQ